MGRKGKSHAVPFRNSMGLSFSPFLFPLQSDWGYTLYTDKVVFKIVTRDFNLTNIRFCIPPFCFLSIFSFK